MSLSKAHKLTLVRAKLARPALYNLFKKMLRAGFELQRERNSPPYIAWPDADLVFYGDRVLGWEPNDGLQKDVNHASMYLCFVIELLILKEEIEDPFSA